MTTPDPLEHLWARTQPRVTRAIRNAHTWLDGHPPTSIGAGTSSGGTGDRTGTLATRHATHGDHHGDLRRDLERTIHRLADLVDRLAPTNRAAAHLERHAAPGDPGCTSCARITDSRGRPWWNPVHRNGRCQWCNRTLARLAADYAIDELPTKVVQWRHDFGRDITSDVAARLMAGVPRRVDST